MSSGASGRSWTRWSSPDGGRPGPSSPPAASLYSRRTRRARRILIPPGSSRDADPRGTSPRHRHHPGPGPASGGVSPPCVGGAQRVLGPGLAVGGPPGHRGGSPGPRHAAVEDRFDDVGRRRGGAGRRPHPGPRERPGSPRPVLRRVRFLRGPPGHRRVVGLPHVPVPPAGVRAGGRRERRRVAARPGAGLGGGRRRRHRLACGGRAETLRAELASLFERTPPCRPVPVAVRRGGDRAGAVGARRGAVPGGDPCRARVQGGAGAHHGRGGAASTPRTWWRGSGRRTGAATSSSSSRAPARRWWAPRPRRSRPCATGCSTPRRWRAPSAGATTPASRRSWPARLLASDEGPGRAAHRPGRHGGPPGDGGPPDPHGPPAPRPHAGAHPAPGDGDPRQRARRHLACWTCCACSTPRPPCAGCPGTPRCPSSPTRSPSSGAGTRARWGGWTAKATGCSRPALRTRRGDRGRCGGSSPAPGSWRAPCPRWSGRRPA